MGKGGRERLGRKGRDGSVREGNERRKGRGGGRGGGHKGKED